MASSDLHVVISNGRVTLLGGERPLIEANRFLEAVRVRGLSLRTARAYAFDLLCFYRWLSHTKRQLLTLCSADLVDFIAEQQRTGSAPARSTVA